MSYIKPKGSIIFTMPPSANACWRQFNGRTILSSKYREWRKNNIHKGNHGDDIEPFPFPVFIVITVRPGKGWRKCDLDNRIKPILDQMQHCGYLSDDNTDYVKGISIRLGDDAGDGMDSYVEIDAERIDEDER
jgi:crossover junction endodeoxyribonuclease RusA